MKVFTRSRGALRAAGGLVACSVLAMTIMSSSASAQDIKAIWASKNQRSTGPKVNVDPPSDTFGAAAAAFNPNSAVAASFEGLSQYDAASFNRNFIPPDTMGAVGTTQYVQLLNGVFGVFDKATGANVQMMSDNQFWANAGVAFNAGCQCTNQGDPRVLFNAQANRWIALDFAPDLRQIQIAVSDTADATGAWKSTSFTSFNSNLYGAIADFPTLAMDKNAIYIGTNNYGSSTPAGSATFRGTTLNVIPLSDIFNAASPSAANVQQFVTPYTPGGVNQDYGFAIQGVNSNSNSTAGHVVASSLFDYGVVAYDVNNAGSGSATRGSTVLLGTPFNDVQNVRQPNALNPRTATANDERTGSNAWEANGRIYVVQTIGQDGPAAGIGDSYDRVRVYVIDEASHAVLDQVNIGEGTNYDYFQGSLAVNANGDVVVGYNRSGSGADGKISVMASMFTTGADGKLTLVGGEQLLRESLTDDYHNGSLKGQAATGRQRWGDYSTVTLDPTDPTKFWVLGEYAREYNTPADGHPTGTGGSRWGTWISEINFAAAVPEPSTWLMMIAGFGFVGAAARRARASKVSYA